MRFFDIAMYRGDANVRVERRGSFRGDLGDTNGIDIGKRAAVTQVIPELCFV